MQHEMPENLSYGEPPSSARGEFSEDVAVKDPAMHLLGAVGWEDQGDLYAEWAGPDSAEGRRSMKDAILLPRLQRALRHLNPDMPEEGQEKAVEALLEDRRAMPPQEAARAFHALLRGGVKVRVSDGKGGFETRTVRVIDWGDPRNNHFFAATEFWMQGEVYKRRADIVGFVNGLPLLLFELKAPGVSVKHAFEGNLRDYKETIPQLFTPNAITVLTNGGDTRIGSAFAPWEHFYDWKKVDREEEEGTATLETVIRGVCAPERLLDIAENFTVFEETKDGLIKKVAKNHQYLGVNNAIRAVESLTDDKRQLGVFWHTQGSGKSLSMAFFSSKVLRKMPGNWTFVIVTDRTELDDQIYKTFARTGLVTEQEAHATSVKHLRQLLSEDHRFVFTLIHKFQTQGGEAHPVLSERDDIIVITDEAHRSQYDTLAMNMRQALPNAAFLGFTGTPLMAGEEKTREVFGEYVSIYNFTQSIEDGATVPLYYENRIPELELDEEVFQEGLNAILEEAELDEDQERELQRRFAREYHLITRPDRLQKVAADLVDHFLGRGHRGKAMMVCIDKATAVRMYDLVQEEWRGRIEALRADLAGLYGHEAARAEARIEEMKAADMAVIVSQAQNEAAELAKKGLDITPHRKRINSDDLDERFKDAKDPLRLVFVCAMWITGFDAPSISTIYLDKPMKNHTLMQTIARANRNSPGKEAGLIVDYVGVFRNLQAALAIYGKPTAGGDAPIKDKAALIEHLKSLIDEARVFCGQVGADLDAVLTARPGSPERLGAFQSAVDALISPEETRKSFLKAAGSVNKVYKAVLPDERASPFAPAAILLSTLAKRIRDDTDAPDVSTVMGRVEALLDETISAEDYRMPGDGPQALVNLAEVDFEALQAKFETGKKKTEAERLKALLETKVRKMVQLNKSRADLLEKLQALIDRYNTGSRNVEGFFDDLKDFLGELKAEDSRAMREGLSEEELAIFDILTRPEPELTEKERTAVKAVAKELLETLRAQKLVIDWWKRQQTKAEVRRSIEIILDKGLPQTPYDRRVFSDKSEQVYTHVYESYGGAGKSVYADLA
jgi:type I restriction enzyme R subunit